MKLGNVRLLVDNFDDCFDFWTQTIGATVTWGKKGDAYAHFQLAGGGDIAIFSKSMMAEAVGTQDLPANESAQDRVCLVVEVESVDDLYAELTSKGIEFVTEPKDMDQWGIRTAHLRSPDGILIELASDL